MTQRANTKESFSAREAARIAGVPYASLDYWARTKLVVPSIADAKGTGTERRYSFNDLVALRVAAGTSTGWDFDTVSARSAQPGSPFGESVN
jgi:MerR HTH family regulatory protein